MPVESNFAKLCETGLLYKASTEPTDYTQITLDADTYIPNTYFYLYVDGDKETYTLDTSSDYNAKRTYYQGVITLQDSNAEFDVKASYFMFAPILATESKKKELVRYYRFTELTKLYTSSIFDYNNLLETPGPMVVGR